MHFCRGIYQNKDMVGILDGGNVVGSDGAINKMVVIMVNNKNFPIFKIK